MKHTENGPLGMYYEEFEIGMKLRTRGRTITETDIVQFAALTGDYNPMHTDAEFAKAHMVEQRVAHGMLTLSYAVGQIYQLGFLEGTTITFRGIEMKFSLPVFIGDTIHVEVEVAELKPMRRLGGGTVTSDVRIINQDGKVVQSGTMTMLMQSQPEAD